MENSSITPLGPTHASVYHWCLRGVVFPSLSILYCIIFRIFRKYPSDFKTPYYLLIQTLSFYNAVDLLGTVLLGFMPQALGYFYLSPTVEQIFSFIRISVSSYPCFAIDFCIAFNRCCAIVLFTKYKNFFTIKLTYLFICLSLAFGVIYYLSFVLNCAILMNFENVVVSFYKYAPPKVCDIVSIRFKLANVIHLWLAYGFIFLLYFIAMFVQLFRKAHIHQELLKKEMKLLFQAFCTSVLMIIHSIILNYFPQYIYIVSTELQYIVPLMNPVIYLAFDNTIRKHLFCIFRSSATVVVILPLSNVN